MKSEALVSIIIPVYNKENQVERAIKSVLKQSYGRLEVVIIDDGSSDSSSIICREMEAHDHRIVYRYKDNAGVSSARNLGIDISNGEYIAFLDADDEIEANHIEIMVDRLEQDRSDIAALANITIRKSSLNRGHSDIVDSNMALRSLMLLRYPTSVWAAVYRRSAIANVRMQEGIHFFEDFLFNYEVLRGCDKVSLVHADSYHYDINETSINRAAINMKKMSCLMICDYIVTKLNPGERALPEMEFFRAHCMISLLISLAAIRERETEYSVILSEKAKSIILKASLSRHVPLLYKLVILTASVNIGTALSLIRYYESKKSVERTSASRIAHK